MVLRKLSRTFMVSLAFMVATFSSGLLQPAVAYATPGNDNGPDPKVFVCKYVGTPGINETLQTGQNPISVSSNTTGGTAVGSSFADAQGRSFVLSIDNTEPGPAGDPTVSACPAPQGPTSIPVPTVPTNDPCGPANIVFGTIPTSANYTIVQNATSVTFTAKAGFVFTGGSTIATVNLPADSNIACPVIPTVINIPTVPTTDPCGPHNIAFGTIPTSANYTLFAQTSTSLTFKAATGFTFPGGHLYAVVDLPADSNVACPTVIDVPTVPSTDPCGPNNVVFGAIPTSANYTHVVNGNGSVTFTAATGFVFTGGSVTANVTLPTDTNEVCDVCPNIAGTQVTVPVDRMLVDGKCENFKVFVCKYVSIPGIGERLQTGQNPISVSVNSIPNYQGVGSSFADAQGRSFVLAVDDTEPGPAGDPARSACPTTEQSRADITYTLLCIQDGVRITFVNNGDLDGVATLNGSLVNVAEGATVQVDLPYTSGFKTVGTVTINGVTTEFNKDCTPGGGGGTPETPVTPTTPGQTLGTTTTAAAAVLPAVLPATGGIDSPFMVVVASILAYGAAYFLQGRRSIARKEAMQA